MKLYQGTISEILKLNVKGHDHKLGMCENGLVDIYYSEWRGGEGFNNM